MRSKPRLFWKSVRQGEVDTEETFEEHFEMMVMAVLTVTSP